MGAKKSEADKLERTYDAKLEKPVRMTISFPANRQLRERSEFSRGSGLRPSHASAAPDAGRARNCPGPRPCGEGRAFGHGRASEAGLLVSVHTEPRRLRTSSKPGTAPHQLGGVFDAGR